VPAWGRLGRNGQTWPVRAERGGYPEFYRQLAHALDGRGEVPARPEEVIELVRIIEVLPAGHRQRDRGGGHATDPGADR
jgi:scyllo-inositol 2-dehydrogenase (NADP+)